MWLEPPIIKSKGAETGRAYDRGFVPQLFVHGSIDQREMSTLFSFNSSTSWRPEPTERGTFSILSTCILTLALCVWTAVHLNIPAYGERLAQTRRKGGWMMLGVIAPEVVPLAYFLSVSFIEPTRDYQQRELIR